MKAGTLRNLMASMLVLGVASSVIGVGSGTFATFNATTTNLGTFATGNIIFHNTPNGGTPGTGTSDLGTPLGTASSCTALNVIGSMVPGDSKLNKMVIQNDASSARAVTVALTTSASPSTALDANAPGAGATAGLGMLIFRCTNGSGVELSCTAANMTPVEVYPTAGGCTVPSIASGGLIPSVIGNDATATITVNGPPCTGGAFTNASFALGGPDTVATGIQGLNTGSSDNLAIILYLPDTATNGQAGLTSGLSFQWIATQINGTAQ
ncbi:MAG TPA: hypothetical protein VMW62_03190 [Chloroflexota bacterium]|nr:hypothetical protein [Chloroflexota bacterium]